jgi:hypothetical protein
MEYGEYYGMERIVIFPRSETYKILIGKTER